MAGLKYDKYILKNKAEPRRHEEETVDLVGLRAGRDFGGIPLSISFETVDKPFTMIKAPHTHTFQQFLGFLGGNVMNPLDLNAEVELYLGEEMEKHLITESSFVHIPPGLSHGPLIFKKIGWPLRFYQISLTDQYQRTNTTK